MDERDPSPPEEADAERVDARDGTDVFALVGDETRVAILRALVRARREGVSPVGFADLRRRVGVRDSGNFNYHVGRLVGSLVARESDGYRLTYLGEFVVGALLSGTHESHAVRVDPDHPCPYCGAAFDGTYEDGVLDLTCETGHYFEAYLPPGAAAERSPEALLSLAGRTLRTHLRYFFDEVCPFCYGRVPLSAESVDAAHGSGVVYRGVCERCGHPFRAPPELAAVDDPAVVAFYHERGTDVTRGAPWELDLGPVDATVATDPTRVTVTLRAGEDAIEVVLDGSATVQSATRTTHS